MMLDKSSEHYNRKREQARERQRRYMAKLKSVSDADTERVSEADPEPIAEPVADPPEPVAAELEPVALKPAESPLLEEFQPQPAHPAHDEEQSSNAPSIDISRPPKRLPVRTKGRWQTLPEWLREDIIAREEEFDSAFKRYDGLGQYALEAEKNHTTLANAIRDYAEIEGKFRTDTLEAPMHVWTRMGLDPTAWAVAFAGRFAPDSGRAAYEVGFHAGNAAGAIEQFAQTHSDFELLRPRMAAIATADPSLPIDGVYSQAKWSDPITRVIEVMKRHPQPIARNPATAIALSKMAAKHVGGAPSTAPCREIQSDRSTTMSARRFASSAEFMLEY